MPGHIRFGDDDPPTAEEIASDSTVLLKPKENGQSRLDTESDDDAPEEVAQTLARDKVKTARREATRAIEGQRAAEKQKRRSQADRFKQQAGISKRGSKRKRINGGRDEDNKVSSASRNHDSDDNDFTIDENRVSKLSRKKALPDLLPDEILAVDPPPRLPTPEFKDGKSPNESPPRTAQTFEQKLAKADKPPKDVKRGPVKVRVLEKKNALLPPRANTQSRNLLDAMRHRHGALEQKAVKKVFATRPGSGR